ncbi:MAG TPA: hypothetical protein VJ552_09435, partial [Sediminibacterium sp.]|nr:hypothetical protein [Sediminibacterium sp.]
MLQNIWHDLTGNTANLIAAVSSVGTLLTVIIAYRAIKETQRQRESSYRPDLYLETSSAHLISPEFRATFGSVRFLQEKRIAPSDGHKVNKQENDYEYDEDRFLPPQRWMLAHFFNIGLGTAKAIEYRWEFDLIEAISILKSLSGSSGIRVELANDDQLGNNMLYSIVQDHLRYSQYINRLDIEHVGSADFIRSNSVPLIQTQVTISDAYLQILIAYLFNKYDLIVKETTDYIDETFDDL